MRGVALRGHSSYVKCALALAALAPCLFADSLPLIPPTYSADTIVSAASGQPGALAPNTIITIYGKNLSFETKNLTADLLSSGVVPRVLPGSGTQVAIGNYGAPLFYVSPTQINCLVPSDLLAGPSTLRVTRQGVAGPEIRITLAPVAPAAFQLDRTTLLATHLDGSLVNPYQPAQPGEIITIYATGLGETSPSFDSGHLADRAASLRQLRSFRAWLGGTALSADSVLYAGVSPGFAGLYQINLRLPLSLSPTPELRIGFDGGAQSPAGLILPTFTPQQ